MVENAKIAKKRYKKSRKSREKTRDIKSPRLFLPLKYIPSPFYPPLINFEKFNESLAKYQAKVRKWSYLKNNVYIRFVAILCFYTKNLEKSGVLLRLVQMLCFFSTPLFSTSCSSEKFRSSLSSRFLLIIDSVPRLFRSASPCWAS